MIAFSCGLVVASTVRINGPEKGHLSILEGRVGIKGSNLVIGCVAATLSLVGGRGGVWGVQGQTWRQSSPPPSGCLGRGGTSSPLLLKLSILFSIAVNEG